MQGRDNAPLGDDFDIRPNFRDLIITIKEVFEVLGRELQTDPAQFPFRCWSTLSRGGFLNPSSASHRVHEDLPTQVMRLRCQQARSTTVRPGNGK